jgi:hypothetical protein
MSAQIAAHNNRPFSVSTPRALPWSLRPDQAGVITVVDEPDSVFLGDHPLEACVGQGAKFLLALGEGSHAPSTGEFAVQRSLGCTCPALTHRSVKTSTNARWPQQRRAANGSRPCFRHCVIPARAAVRSSRKSSAPARRAGRSTRSTPRRREVRERGRIERPNSSTATDARDRGRVEPARSSAQRAHGANGPPRPRLTRAVPPV